MRPPLFVHPLAAGEQQQREDALRSSDAFTLRRAQYLLASARGSKPKEIAAAYGGCEQTVRNVIRAFAAGGLGCLTPGSHRPKSARPLLGGAEQERLRQILHQSPRVFGKDTSLWTQALLAEVAHAEGLTEQPVSDETIRRALKRLDVGWKRAKHWLTSPDPQYAVKKSGAGV